MTAMNAQRRLLPAAIAFAIIALGADEPMKTIKVDTLSFQAPASWKKVTPTNSMRKAQFEVGATEPAELSISSFGGGGGGTKANVDRWKGQFKSKDGGAVDAETKTTTSGGVEITRVEVSGVYTDPFSKAGPKADTRLLGAIIADGSSAYILKLIGPDKTVLAAEPGFDALLKSVKLAKE